MNNMDFDKIGKFIAKLRKDKKLTQLQLAELIGASDKTISKWENGNSFPDLIYQSKLCNALDIELDELHAGELNLKRRKRRKLRKILNRLIALYAAITIPLIVFLCLFFVNNYDATKIYRLDTLNDSVQAVVQGILVETNQSRALYIGKISIWDYEIKDTDIISMDIYSDDNLLFHTNSLESDVVKFDEDVNLDKDKLIIKLMITDKKKKEHNYEIKLNSTDITNEYNQIKVPRISELKLLSEEEIAANLKKNGFKLKDGNWEKSYTKKNTKFVISYFPISNKIKYNSINNTINQNITFLINSQEIEVYIYNKSGTSDILFEQYVYNYGTQDLECQVGVCSTLESVVETMEKYISLLTGE